MTTISATPLNIGPQLAAAAKGGVDTVALTGTFSRIDIRSLAPAVPVTLDCSHAVIDWLTIEGSSNWNISGGEFLGQPYNGIQAADAHHIGVSDAYFHNWTSCAMAWKGCTDLDIERNRFAHSMGDGIDLVSCQRVGIKNNDFWDLTYVVGGNHTDCIQMWKDSVAGALAIQDIDVWDNRLIGKAQFCGMYNPASPTTGIRIRRNKIASGMTWACHLLNTSNSEATDNFAMTLLGMTPSWQPPTWWMTDSGSQTIPDSGKSGNLIARNVNGPKP